MREPVRQFLAPNGRTVTQPLRPPPQPSGAPFPTPEQLAEAERVAEATRMCDEPEKISSAIVDAQGELARTYDALRYKRDLEDARVIRRQLTIEARMADVQRRARLRHADVSGEMHVVKKMLERARAGGRKDPEAAIRRVAVIEARLDWRPDLEDAA